MNKVLVVLFIVIHLALTDPPDPNNAPLMARYLVHSLDWVSIATISTQDDIKSYPFVGLKSMSDGPVTNSTGIPYLYMSNMDVSANDLTYDNRCTILVTEAQSDYCKKKDLDPQDPRCAKVIITGRVAKVNNNTAEYNFAKKALFERHPEMSRWPNDHNFYIAKINIKKIAVLDYFGGMKLVNVEDYFKIKLNNLADLIYNNIEVIQVDV